MDTYLIGDGETLVPPPAEKEPSWIRRLFGVVFGPWLAVRPTAYLLLAATLICPVALIVLYFREMGEKPVGSAGTSEIFLIIGTGAILFAVLGFLSQVGTRSLWVRLGAWLMAEIILGLAFLDNLGDLGHVKDNQHLWPSFVIGGLLACLALPIATLPAFRRLFGAPPATGKVDAIGVALTVSLTMMLLVPLVSFGRPEMEITKSYESTFFAQHEWIADLSLIYWTPVVAALMVGYGIRRNARETLERLGLTGFNGRTVKIGLAAMVFMLGIGQVSDMAIHQAWTRLGWPMTNEGLVDKLFAPNFTLLGALTGGAAAGILEEIMARGILQPRLGIVLSNLFWVSLHAGQYNWDALTSVFISGLFLGVLRQRTNTLCCIITHGGFDMVLFLSPQNS